jgi:hypothetical protein
VLGTVIDFVELLGLANRVLANELHYRLSVLSILSLNLFGGNQMGGASVPLN